MESKKEERKAKRQARKSERKERKSQRKKKEIDISLDTDKIDVDIKRDSDGNVDIIVDTEKVDAHYKKHGDKVSLDVDIQDDKEYLFEGNGKNRKLPKGAFWKITGAVIKTFLRRGWGKIKK